MAERPMGADADLGGRSGLRREGDQGVGGGARLGSEAAGGRSGVRCDGRPDGQMGVQPRGGVDDRINVPPAGGLARPLSAPGDAELLAALQRRLMQQAQDAGLVDVAYTTVDSPVGKLLLASTARGLVRVAFAGEDHDRVLATLAEKLSPRILRAPKRLDAAARELDEYFAGRRRAFDLELDLSLSHGFRRLVQTHLPQIGYGQTRSYRQVAELVGNPRAVRAVGSACATNPLPIVIPCHRVLRSDGSLGGYGGGLDAKRTLLRLETEG